MFISFFWIALSKKSCKLKLIAYFLLTSLMLVLSGFLTVTDSIKISTSLRSFSAILFNVFLISIPPFLFQLFSRLIDNRKEGYHRNYYISYILLIINILSFIYLTYLEPSQIFMYELAEQMINYVNVSLILFIFPISTIFYWFKTFFVIKKRIHENDLVRKLLFNLFFSYSALLICFTIQLKFKEGIWFSLFYCTVIYFLISILILGINEFKNQKTNENYNEKDIDIEENVFFEQIHEKLEPSLIQNRSFLNPKFTLKDCAKSIGTNEKYLSSYLNKIHKMNFNTFINYYRVERAKELLHSTDSDKYTIEAIAQMSGFNSKSSFNAVFKKHTGLTPSEFKLNK